MQSPLGERPHAAREAVHVLELDRAGLPRIPAELEEFERRIEALAEHSAGRGEGLYETLCGLFEALTTEAFGAEYRAFFTQGTLTSFQKLALRFWQAHERAELIATPFEYLPMWYSLPERRRHMVDVVGADFDELELAARMLALGEKLASTAPPHEAAPICLLVSSELRIGGRRLDVDRFAEQVAARNRDLGSRRFHLWIDASQDSRILRSGDVIWYSKRHVGSGGGMVLLRRESYGGPDDPVVESARHRSGYDLRYLMRLVASLISVSSGSYYDVRKLFAQEPPVDGAAERSDLGRELAKAQAFARADRLLRAHVRIIGGPGPVGERAWEPHCVLRLELTELGQRVLPLGALEEELARAKVRVDSFSLEGLRRGGARAAAALQLALDAPGASASAVRAQLERFEREHQDRLGRAVVAREAGGDRAALARYFREAKQQLRCLRLFVTSRDEPGRLLEFLKRLSAVIARLQAPTARPRSGASRGAGS